ncbi:MAG: response regulator transcription factor [Bacilli bacterium]
MIYCVEDDRGIRELIVYTLENTGYPTLGFEQAASFWKEMNQHLPDLVLLDIMLPKENGLDILKKMRANSQTKHLPVILITAKDTEYDKVIGLDSGADDYIAKPFGMMELVSRIKAVLRRYQTLNNSETLEYRNLKLDPKSHLVLVNNQHIELTMKEFSLLQLLLSHLGRVLTRDEILNHIWGFDFDGETRTVDVHIKTLRHKLQDAGALIETIRGFGYKIGEKK